MNYSALRWLGAIGTVLALAASCGVPDASYVESDAGAEAGVGGTGADSGGDGGLLACTTDADCAAPNSRTPICNVVSGRCVECLTTNDTCEAGFYCGGKDTCQIGCNADDDCLSPAVCDVEKHLCSGCSDSGQCRAGTMCSDEVCVPGCSETATCPIGWTCCGGACANTAVDETHCGACEVACSEAAHSTIECQDGACLIVACEENYHDCNAAVDDGCEADLLADNNNCGACGEPCAAGTSCAAGVCKRVECATGRADCDDDGTCETSTETTTDCGGCGKTCAPAHATGSCSLGVCDIASCTPGYADCDDVVANGCEVNLDTTVAHCGGCDDACSTVHGAPSCRNGVCSITCDNGFGNCDEDVANGCELALATDRDNCGACGNKCTNEHGGTACSNGICVPSCAAGGYYDCDGDPANGCESDTTTDEANCGACRAECAPAHATPSCIAGVCTIESCTDGYANCDEATANGCEVHVETSTEDCGACGQPCSTNNATPTCAAGKCILACAPDFADCDGDLSNGCEANLKTSVVDCQTCGHVCSTEGGTPKCVDGICGVSDCTPPMGDCDGQPANGCEINTAVDVNNCGACGASCSIANGTAGCAGGVCVVQACHDGYADCDGLASNGCEQRLNTLSHCGACRTTCALPNATTSCATGSCELDACVNAFADCDGQPSNGCEVDLLNDPANCNTCGAACNGRNGTSSCRDGACEIACEPNFGDCNADASDGCETSLVSNDAHCGTCGNVCLASHGSAACNGVACMITGCLAGFGDCDNQYATGCEAALTTDPLHCGACGEACSSAQGTPTCVDGACGISCATGFADCNADASDGCETNVLTSMNNCGGCGQVCSLPNATSACSNGACGLLGCSTGFANCDLVVANGCEVNTRSDAAHCSGCNLACNVARATEICSAGACAIGSCDLNYSDCDGVYSNGCEVNLTSSASNCGECDNSCTVPNATSACIGGLCTMTSCQPGYEDCDGLRTNGCEVNTTSSVTNCGGCNHVCSASGGTPYCSNSTCGISSCTAPFADCDANTANGCEANLNTSALHCGSCGNACSASNATTACANGSCSILACNAGYADCNGLYSDGCETATTTLVNCGSCGTTCNLPNANESCAAGVCQITSCTGGYADCDDDPANGCEANLATDVANCNGCGNGCSAANGTPACSSGVCSTLCDTGYGDCDALSANGCETSITTLSNCGACGLGCVAANGTPACTAQGGLYSCAISGCNSGYADCNTLYSDGCETNIRSSISNCGSCGNACSGTNGTASCVSGACEIACSANWGNCDLNAANGCEVNITTSTAHCGSCGNACSFPHAAATCAAGSCVMGACGLGFSDCNAQTSDGCERDLMTDAANCGACGNTCSNAHGTTSCMSGGCSPVCSAGYASCDSNDGNGCETSITTTSNCGGCGNVCTFAHASAACTSGSCAIGACDYQYGNCDNDLTNGCERNLSNDLANCGACGHVCSNTHGTASCSLGSCGIACSAGYGDCDFDVSTGCETSLRTITDCGVCGQACDLQNATASCSTGSCAIASCDPGYADCDGVPTNGCEVHLETDPGHCGTCETVCNATAGTALCAAGQCGISCDAGYGDCDENLANGCETFLTDNDTHCGACGNSCAAAHATAACTGNNCTITTCAAGYGDCDGAFSNGCETNLLTDTSSCGACGTVCNATHGTPTCGAGACGITCDAGHGDCDLSAVNGCETDLLSSTAHCGGCGLLCALANSTSSCSAGACSISSCNPGFADCDGLATNGCEANLQTDATHCGTCSRACNLPNSTEACSAGSCVIGSCDAGHRDCNGVQSDGCEVNITSDATNCGACGAVCNVANATEGCSSSSCTIVSCDAGYEDCDGAYGNGCETNTASNVNNCGACSHACPRPVGTTPNCVAGVCGISSCTEPYADCDGQSTNSCEVDTSTDPQNCGDCGTVCDAANASTTCSAGLCSIASCALGYADCDAAFATGCETNTNVSLTDCGACGAGCALANANEACTSGSCRITTCNTGFANCDGLHANGCEVDVTSNAAHCNGCDAACSDANGTPACVSGACQIACDAGWGNCDLDVSDGCEAPLDTIVNCGACGVACAAANGTPACTAGACAVGACNSGYGNCNGLYLDGCETNTRTSVTHCGACGSACSTNHAAPTCTAGTCVLDCSDNYDDCNSNVADGCETDLRTAPNHCGACGSVCTYPHAAGVCSSGACSMGACEPGYGNCNSSTADGCEAALNTTSNCGSCGVACSNGHGTTACVAGECAPVCATGWADCDGNPNNGCETDLTTNTNCGVCGRTCTFAHATGACTGGVCALSSCDSGYDDCDGDDSNGCEQNVTSDESNCGGCNDVCDSTNGIATCTLGACSVACTAGFGNCNNSAADGCEVNLSTNANHCSACNAACSSVHATPTCSAGVCSVTCSAGWGDCTGGAADGCETDITTAANCGACANACTVANGTPTCAAGACAIASCDPPHADCDEDYATGCETDSDTDATHCGACENVCNSTNGTGTCALGACGITCGAGWGNCDGNLANGCERDVRFDDANCGACGNACSGATSDCQNGVCVAPPGISLVNANTTGAGSPNLTLTHNLQSAAGSNRLVVLALTGRANSVSDVTPDSVTYAGAAMTLGLSTAMFNNIWVSFYYIKDANLPPAPGARAVVITSNASGGSSFGYVANVLEFRGVNQATPIDATGSGSHGSCSNSMPFSDSIGVVTANAYVVEMNGLFPNGTPVGTPASGQTKTVEAKDTTLSYGEVSGIGGYIGPVTAGTKSLGWNFTNACHAAMHGIIALRPG